ncbi:MAG: glycosyltransferase 87 family protein [Saccharofermentans sp.]|nr:glycosyltransferase 87 family protein [Saccharofermentans sp.]
MNNLALKNNSKSSFEYIFFASVFITFAYWTLSFLIWRNSSIDYPWRIFFRSTRDLFADTTNVVGYSGERNVYNDMHYTDLAEKAYPPLTYMILWFFSKTINMDVYYKEEYFVNLYQNPKFLVVFLVYALISILILYEAIRSFKNGSNITKSLMGFSIIFSSPMLYALERANVIILCLICVLYYVFNYNSENKIKKEIALICFALAFALKITPAVLGILLIYDKKIKEAVRAILYSVIAFFAPFFFFYGKFTDNVSQMLKNILKNLDKYSEPNGCSFISLVSEFAKISPKQASIIGIFAYIIGTTILVGAFFQKNKWKQIMSVLIVLIVVPSHAEFYCILFIIPGVILFLNEEHHDQIECIILIGICLVFDIIFFNKNYQHIPLFGLSVILVYFFIVNIRLIAKTIISASNSNKCKAK